MLSLTVSQLFDSHGWLLRNIGRHGIRNGELHRPQSLVFDRANNFVIADAGNHRILILNEQGEHVTSFSPFSDIDGNETTSVCVDNEGRVFVGGRLVRVFAFHDVC